MNGKIHRKVGIAVGAGLSLWRYAKQLEEDPETEFPAGDFLLGMLAGYAFATIPDLLEPAISSHHRKFFHSVSAGALLAGAVWGKNSDSWPPDMREIARCFAVQYLTHLALDFATPRSVSLIHPRIV